MKNLDGSAVKDVGVLSISKKHCRRVIYVHSGKHFGWSFWHIYNSQFSFFFIYLFYSVHELTDKHNILIFVHKRELWVVIKAAINASYYSNSYYSSRYDVILTLEGSRSNNDQNEIFATLGLSVDRHLVTPLSSHHDHCFVTSHKLTSQMFFSDFQVTVIFRLYSVVTITVSLWQVTRVIHCDITWSLVTN